MKKLVIIMLVIAVMGCGGGGGEIESAPPTPSPPNGEQEAVSEFIQQAGNMVPEHAIGMLENVFQIAHITNHYFELLRADKRLFCENGIFVTANIEHSSSIVEGSSFIFNFQNCESAHIDATLIGEVLIEVKSLKESSHILEIDLSQLRTKEVDLTIRLTGKIKLEAINTFDEREIKVSMLNTDSKLVFSLENKNISEVIESLNVSKVTDYRNSSFSIDGHYSVSSELLNKSYRTSFKQPLSGPLNSPALSGELMLSDDKNNVLLKPVSNSKYQLHIAKESDDSYTTSSNLIYSWQDSLNGALFVDPYTTVYLNPEHSVFSETHEEAFNFIDVDREKEFEIQIFPKSTVKYLFSKPLDNSSLVISFKNLATGKEVKPSFTVEGNILEITTDLVVANAYSLELSLVSMDGNSLHIRDFYRVGRPIILAINGPAIALENSQIELNAKDLSVQHSGQIVKFEWSQVSGPSLNFDNAAGIIDIQLPRISGEYEEVHLVLRAIDGGGNEGFTETKILILKEDLNRHAIYIPFAEYEADRVRLLEDNNVYREKGNKYVVNYYDVSRTDYDDLLKTQVTSEKISNIGVHNSFFDASSSIDSCDSKEQLGDEFWTNKIIVEELFQENDVVELLNYQFLQYCLDEEVVRTNYAVRVQDNIIEPISQLFLFSGNELKYPSTLPSQDIRVDGDISVVEDVDREFKFVADNVVENSQATVSISNGKVKEKYLIDIIGNLNNKAFFYYNSAIKLGAEPTRPLIFNSFHKLLERDRVTATVSNTAGLHLNIDIVDGQHRNSVTIYFPEKGIELNTKVLTTGDSLESRPYLVTSFNSSACQGEGWYKIYDYGVDNEGKVTRLALDFYQQCHPKEEYNSGAVWINTNIPFQVSDLDQ